MNLDPLTELKKTLSSVICDRINFSNNLNDYFIFSDTDIVIFSEYKDMEF